MSFEKVTKAQSRVIIGKNQTLKAMHRDEIAEVYYALDADKHLVQDVIQLAQEQNIPCVSVDSMEELGSACGIKVGASTVAIKR